MSNKHMKTDVPTDADLKGNPGIGTSKGMTMSGGDPRDLEGESTFEGDVDNETDAGRRHRSEPPPAQEFLTSKNS